MSYTIDTTPRSWDDALATLIGPHTPVQEALARVQRGPKVKTLEQQEAAERAAKAKARKAWWVRAITRTTDFLTRRARDLALAAIVIGTGVAVFQGSLTSATLFGFSGPSAIAFAVMPDALMIVSASVMRGVGVHAAQRREAKISMYFSLLFSLVSNMIAASYITMSAWFTPGVIAGGAIAYHAIIVVFLWRAVETVTKTREDTPSVRRGNAHVVKARKAAEAKVPAQRAGRA